MSIDAIFWYIALVLWMFRVVNSMQGSRGRAGGFWDWWWNTWFACCLTFTLVRTPCLILEEASKSFDSSSKVDVDNISDSLTWVVEILLLDRCACFKKWCQMYGVSDSLALICIFRTKDIIEWGWSKQGSSSCLMNDSTFDDWPWMGNDIWGQRSEA